MLGIGYNWIGISTRAQSEKAKCISEHKIRIGYEQYY